MTIARRPGAQPAPRPALANSRQGGAGEPVSTRLSDEDILSIVRSTVRDDEPSPSALEGLSGEALMSAMLDAEIATHTAERPIVSVFGSVDEVEASVIADVERQASIAAMQAAAERERQVAAQQAHDEQVGRRWARVRRVTWIAGTITVLCVIIVAVLLVLDSRYAIMTTPVDTPSPVPTQVGYQVDPSMVTRG